jgi:ribosomal protein L34
VGGFSPAVGELAASLTLGRRGPYRYGVRALTGAPQALLPVAGHTRVTTCRDVRHLTQWSPTVSKRTFQPNNRRRAKTHGFRLRMRTRAGRAIISARRRKGRNELSA